MAPTQPRRTGSPAPVTLRDQLYREVMASVMWFRRDLRLLDQPALNAAAADGPVVALFVLDDTLRTASGAPRLAFLYRSLRALEEDLRAQGGRLIVRAGRPEDVVPAVAREVRARSVHVSEDFNPYGRARDQRVEHGLGETPLVRTGSPYAIAPGRIVKSDGTPYEVYSPFYRMWHAHGWRAPAPSVPAMCFLTDIEDAGIPADPPMADDVDLPAAGEAAARAAWARFRENHLRDYAQQRDRPDLDTTSRMSVYLKFGNLHPRTLLAELGSSDETYRKELAWREFYACVLHFHPESAREYYRPEMSTMSFSSGPTADQHFRAWQQGRTGFPIVDAGMRQLLAQGWMHNRLRMIVASFLVKDLHLEWPVGARHFMAHLVDGDLASNQHGWQWTAGTGTDAAPYFRVFNPTTQGLKFDPNGDYVRRWVPQLRGLAGSAAHEPAKHGGAPGYPAPIVDHSSERLIALQRYQSTRTG